MEKLLDAQKNHEEKRAKLERALQAHEGLLGSFVKIKGKKLPQPEPTTSNNNGDADQNVTAVQKALQFETLAPVETYEDSQSSFSSYTEPLHQLEPIKEVSAVEETTT